MELFLVSSIIIIFTFLNILSFIVGFLKSTPGMVFLGTVHYPLDYFYYLSQIIQGKENWFFSYHLGTGEFTQKVLLGWVYVFFGRLFLPFSLTPIAIYQIMVILFSLLYLFSAYMLIKSIFPSSVKNRLLAFILFLTSNGFPRLLLNQGKWTVSFYDSWNNYGFPFIRLGNVPHHLLIHSLIMLILLFTIWMMAKKTYTIAIPIIFLLLGSIMASLQPAQWVLLTLSLAVVIIISYLLNHLTGSAKPSLKLLFLRLLFTGLFFIAGIPFIIYLKQLFQLLPFSQASDWESKQQLYLSVKTFILVHGPLLLLAIFGLPHFLRKISVAKIVISVYALLSVIIFFSPLPRLLGVLNTRFLSVVYVLFFALVSTHLITSIPLSKKINIFIQYAIVCLILFVSLPPLWLQLKSRNTFDLYNAYYYLPKDSLSVLEKAKQVSSANDVFLVLWPFEVSFSGLTGRRVYLSNFIATSNYNQRAVLANKFFTGQMTLEEEENFLKNNSIKYVLVYPWTFPSPPPNLSPIYQNNFLMIYQVE